MPTIQKPEEMNYADQGEGWKVRRIAGGELFGGPAMSAFHWILEPRTRGPEIIHGNYDEMLYVIAGSGAAVVGGRRLPLEPESLLWLETGDRCQLESGAQGLDVLQSYAPGD